MIQLSYSPNQRKLYDFALEYAGRQIRTLVETYPDFYPMYTMQGCWKHSGEAWTHWCDGFLPGMMWILHGHLQGKAEAGWWREQAIRYSQPLEPRQHDRAVHDLGFIFMSTYFRWHGFTGEQALKDVLIQAGRTMSLRFQEKGRYLRSFVSDDSLFIDIMMNVGIVFYAAQQTNDRDLLRIATEHCLTTRRYLVRGDGSTSHEGIFDLATGAFLRQTTHQGWRDDSSWARGLTWALYGFGTAYTFTGDERFLDTAQLCADFYIARTPAHGVPPNDWEEPDPILPYESSAAAIAASGLLQLAQLTRAPERADHYRRYAHTILATLCAPEFLAIETSGWEGILKHGSYHERKRLGVNESVMWGEYFFVEALDRLNGFPGNDSEISGAGRA